QRRLRHATPPQRCLGAREGAGPVNDTNSSSATGRAELGTISRRGRPYISEHCSVSRNGTAGRDRGKYRDDRVCETGNRRARDVGEARQYSSAGVFVRAPERPADSTADRRVDGSRRARSDYGADEGGQGAGKKTGAL